MATVETQFFDGNGVLLTGVNVDVVLFDQFGNALSRTTLPPEPDGTYDVPVEVGDKVSFKVYNGERTLGAMSEIQMKVPATQGPLPITVLGGPANDDCANAQALGALPASAGGTTIGASGPDAEAGAACGTSVDAATPGVWYTVVGTGTTLNASTCNSADYDTKISVYCLDCGTPPLCVAGNDDGAGCAGFTSTISWCSQPGVTYRIYVHGFFGSFGNFTLNVTDSGATCTPTVNCIPPPPSGACCNCLPSAPFNCSQGTVDDCNTLFNGEYQGDSSECVVISGTPSVYNNTTVVPIPDNVPAGVTSATSVPDSFFVADLNVGIHITHTWISDLIVRVKHVGTGIEQELWTQQCGSTDNINSTADDEGTNLTCLGIATGGIDVIFWPPAVGGQGPLSIFDGLNANGTWNLNVSDNFAADVGAIQRWQLTFLGGTPLCTGGTGDDDDDDVACEDCQPEEDGKVTICHIPPGNPGGAHTIRVSPSALPAHCGNHGDTCGECGSTPLVHQPIVIQNPTGNGPVDLQQNAPGGTRTERGGDRR
jgi:subtilisin-like proprotein convertase family protein